MVQLWYKIILICFWAFNSNGWSWFEKQKWCKTNVRNVDFHFNLKAYWGDEKSDRKTPCNTSRQVNSPKAKKSTEKLIPTDKIIPDKTTRENSRVTKQPSPLFFCKSPVTVLAERYESLETKKATFYGRRTLSKGVLQSM